VLALGSLIAYLTLGGEVRPARPGRRPQAPVEAAPVAGDGD
jgi:hypothetical protein